MNLLTPFILQSSFSGTQTSVLPLIIVALLIDVIIIVIWYFIGMILNNSRVRESAKGEFYQFLGTAVLVAIIIAAMFIFVNIFIDAYSNNPTLGSGPIGTLCNNIASSSPISALPYILKYPTDICSITSTNIQYASITEQLDYPIATTAVIVANLTNQSATQLNSLFVIDAYIGFLSKLSPTVGECAQLPTPPLVDAPCFIAPTFGADYTLYIKWIVTPFAGLEMIYRAMGTLGVLVATILAFFLIQLLANVTFIYIWPYLMFMGIVLRSTVFTRSLGGLLIAIAVGAVFIYPAIFSLEYTTLTNASAGSTPELAPIPVCGTTYSYQQNFFVLPNIQGIANACGCWPFAGLAGTEALDIAPFQIPSLGTLSSVLISVANLASLTSADLHVDITQYVVPGYCSSGDAENTLFNLVTSYGLIGVTAYFIPIINILITITAIRGLSGLFGGDVSMAGLSRFI